MTAYEFEIIREALGEMRNLIQSSRRRFESGLINKATHHAIERKGLKAIKLLETITGDGPPRPKLDDEFFDSFEA